MKINVCPMIKLPGIAAEIDRIVLATTSQQFELVQNK